MHAPAAQTPPERTLIRNIGLLLSGDLSQPLLDADAILVENGVIAAIGAARELADAGPAGVIDANSSAVMPGLIDSHVHPVFGDWTPRQNQLGWIDSFLNGGVTTMISAGEVHLPGRPKDIVGLKALAITAQRAFSNFRPGGVKLHAGAPILEQGMTEQDFADLAEAGVTLIGEVGLGTVRAGEEAQRMVGWARKHGMQSTIHTGGPSVPGSSYIDKDVVLEADPDIIGHINGGHTALPVDQIRCLCEGCQRGIEIVHNGNERAGLFAARAAYELGQPERIILGTDSPAGSGVQPLGILRVMALLAGVGELPPEHVVCFATGNTARMRGLDSGLIEVGRPADLLFAAEPQHSAGGDILQALAMGDLPGVGMVMIDGIIRCHRSRHTPPTSRLPEVVAP